MKTTLTEIGNILNSDQKKTDKHYYGVIKAVNRNADTNKVESYDVSLGGDADVVKCRKTTGAKLGDKVLVTLLSTGTGIVTNTIGGDSDAGDALDKAKDAQDTADSATITAANAIVVADGAADDAEAAAAVAAAASSAASTAATTATSYITTITGRSGICIHDANDTSNYANLRSTGLGIYKDGEEVATFSDNIQLGKTDDSTIYMCNDKGVINVDTDESTFDIGTSGDGYNLYLYADDDKGSIELSRSDFTVNVSSTDILKASTTDFQIRGTSVADWVCEEGNSSDWYYRKWKSGKCELWRSVTASFAMTTSYQGGYSCADARTLTLPFSVSNAVCFGTGYSNGHSVVCSASGTTFSYRPFRMNLSASTSRTFYFKIEGTY